MLTEEEKEIIIALLEGQKDSVKFLVGFGEPDDEDREKIAFYNKIIEKVKNL